MSVSKPENPVHKPENPVHKPENPVQKKRPSNQPRQRLAPQPEPQPPEAFKLKNYPQQGEINEYYKNFGHFNPLQPPGTPAV